MLIVMPATPRPGFVWRLRQRELPLGARTLLMAILNLTSDSFHVASRVAGEAAVLARAEQALEEGADVLDLGAESTRPGAVPVHEEEETRRLVPALEAVRRRFPQAVLSVDTRHAAVARRALGVGADIINDVSGLGDAAMPALLAESGCGSVLMHLRGTLATMHQLPPQDDPLPDVLLGLRAVVERARAAGIAAATVVLDPGFGFGKNGDENYRLLAQLDRLHGLGFPLLVGISRKSFIGRTLDQAPPEARLAGTLAATAAAVLAGAHLVRAHDVAATRDALRIADALRAAGGVP